MGKGNGNSCRALAKGLLKAEGGIDGSWSPFSFVDGHGDGKRDRNEQSHYMEKTEETEGKEG